MNTNWAKKEKRKKKIEIDFFLWALTISPILESLLPIV